MKLLFLLIASALTTFLEPQQKRDSVLVADHIRYGVVLKDIQEGTPIALPEIKMEGEAPFEFLGGWQLDSTRVSRKKEVPARYDIKASLTLIPYWGGEYDLPDIPVIVAGDTLVFKSSSLDVREPQVDMENYVPADIKPQIKVPYTFAEVAPWAGGALVIGLGIFFFVRWLRRRKKQADSAPDEPAHLKALRKLDAFRGDKHWKAENQKAFYSGVTDVLREYMAARYGIDAMEMTTAEIFDELRGSDIPAGLYEDMKELFERSDFVKFAKHTATAEENASVLPSAVRFVTETYRQEIESDEI